MTLFKILLALLLVSSLFYFLYWVVIFPILLTTVHNNLKGLWDDLRLAVLQEDSLSGGEFGILRSLLSQAIRSTSSPLTFDFVFRNSNTPNVPNKAVNEQAFASPQGKRIFAQTLGCLFAAGLLANPFECIKMAALAVLSLFSPDAAEKIEESKRQYTRQAACAH